MIIHEVKQGSEEWFALRAGKMTASGAQSIGANGKGLETYIIKKMAEFYSVGGERFSNSHTQRGNELEDQARTLYSLENDVVVDEVGFIEHSEFIGCSPDGLVGEDGGVEIKCHDDSGHFVLMLGAKIDSKYLWQIQMNLLITGRKWWDYIAYNPNFKKSLIVQRIEPDEKMHEKLLEGFKTGESRIREIRNQFNNLTQ